MRFTYPIEELQEKQKSKTKDFSKGALKGFYPSLSIASCKDDFGVGIRGY